ncbi:hypothetical protein CDV31_014398 [Fusarium ambrosium]|uniref:Heterokaryon incompatibility domain-containing protein n=1 Tax=Fusarium ambrosium TaxID=131363 RepID=A0A428SWY2_9HYPO|nr:hypothetical protein CDV31_014398 [Fusarium ambrosium]
MASNKDQLCQRCSDIDLIKVFSGGYETPHLVIELGDVPQEQRKSSCGLCRLIAEAVYRPFCNEDLASYHDTCDLCEQLSPEQDDEPQPYLLLAVEIPLEKNRDSIGHSESSEYMDTTNMFKVSPSRSKSHAKAPAALPVGKLEKGTFIALKVAQKRSPDSQVLSYFGSIYPAFSAPGVPAPARLVPGQLLNYSRLSLFLEECQNKHSACNLVVDPVPIKNLRFIDCKTRRLKKATAKDSFVALSYVWGEKDEELFDDTQLRKGKLPQTPWVIEDAMRVVTKLEYRYLWVDKYCIPQGDDKVLHEHLCQMHLIYQKALFTIVAAAGTRAWHGLPGVWMRDRRAQTYAEINGHLLVSAVEPFPPTSQCKWNTRGWTYQEGLFSPRQLIFTPDQVLFHCTEGEQSEIFTEPVSWQVDKRPCVRDLSVWHHIEAFSKRELTHDSDVLDAIKAIMNAYTLGLGGQAAFLWGVPFAQSPRPLDSSEVLTHISRLDEDPIESASQVFCYGLAWKASKDDSEATPKTSQRRTYFPTWSWASADGSVEFPPAKWPSKTEKEWVSSELVVCIEDVDGRVAPISQYLRKGHIEPSRYLHVEGWSLRDAMVINPMRGEAFAELGEEKYRLKGWFALDPLSDVRRKQVCAILSETQNTKKRWEALVVHIPNSIYRVPFAVILVKLDDPKRLNNDVYERVGCIHHLYVERIPSAERKALRQVQTPPKPSMRWAIEEVRQRELQRERLRAEGEGRLRAEGVEEAREWEKRSWEMASRAYVGFSTCPLRKHGVSNAQGSMEPTTSSKGGEEPLDEKEKSLSEGSEEAFSEDEEFLLEGDDEVLDENDWEKLDKQEALSASSEEPHKDTVNIGSKMSEKTSPVIDSNEEDDANSNYDSALTDSFGHGDQSLYGMDTAGRDQRFFRHLPMVRRSLIIR